MHREEAAPCPRRQRLELCGHELSDGSSRQKPEEGREAFSSGASRRNTARPTHDVSSVEVVSDFWLQNCVRINFCCLRPPSFWQFLTAAIGNWHSRPRPPYFELFWIIQVIPDFLEPILGPVPKFSQK